MKTTTRHPHPALPGRLRQFLALACLSTLSQAATIPDVPLHTMTTAAAGRAIPPPPRSRNLPNPAPSSPFRNGI